MSDKKTILIDFDGTINSYSSGWTGDPTDLPDPPLPGAITWLRQLCFSKRYRPVIFTTRVYPQDVPVWMVEREIRDWLLKYGLEGEFIRDLEITCEKQPCKLIIDDNAFRFEGHYPTLKEIEELTR